MKLSEIAMAVDAKPRGFHVRIAIKSVDPGQQGLPNRIVDVDALRKFTALKMNGSQAISF